MIIKRIVYSFTLVSLTRLFCPELGRFISADVYLSTGQGVLGHNSYAYCLNNPVNAFDGSGQWSLPNWVKVAIGAVALVGAIALTVATGSPNSMGRVGEKMAGIDRSQKKAIRINGRVRIPDELTQTTLKEVKNVKCISNTRQLRDFADYAKATDRSLELWVRPTTKVAKTVIDAGWSIFHLW